MITTERSNLILALLNTVDGASRAYHTNAEFHATINVLADAWMSFGPTLVEQANNRQAEMERQADLLKRTAPLTPLQEDTLR